MESGTWNRGSVGQEENTVKVGLFKIGIENTHSSLMGCIAPDTLYCTTLVLIL